MAPFVDGEIDVGDASAPIVRRRPTPRSATPRSCPLVQIDDRRVAARAVPRADAGVQGRRPAARRPAVRPRPRRAGRARHDRRGHVGRHRLGGHRRRAGLRRTSTSSSSTRQGRVSEVQRRQMTTVDAPNVHTVAVEGTFDDCQDLVKAMFADDGVPRAAPAVRGQLDQLGPGDGPDRLLRHRRAAPCGGRAPACRFSVPTGNFGNVLAGWVARTDGPADRAGSSSARTATTSSPASSHSGIMATSVVVPTLSPSMDIQVSSNFERLLFELNDRDGGMTAEQLQRFRATGSLTVEPDQLDAADAGVRRRPLSTTTRRCAIIADTYGRTGILVDPHTAVGLGAGPRRRARAGGADGHAGHRPPGQVPRRRRARPPASARRCRPTWPTCSSGPSAPAPLPNDLAAVEAFVEAAAAAMSG